VLALALLARTKVDSAPQVGSAFLALVRGDSAAAATKLEAAASTVPECRALTAQCGRAHRRRPS
jgi:hypothetical protein